MYVLRASMPFDARLHARYSATSRSYRYYIITDPNPFAVHRAYYFSCKLDITRMHKAAAMLIGEKSFASFCKKKSQVQHHRCHVMEAAWTKKGTVYIFKIKANRFLHGMVRAMVGTMLDVGRGKVELDAFKAIIRGQDRCMAGRNAPPQGLYLEKVTYACGTLKQA